jgi:hypothetical protein
MKSTRTLLAGILASGLALSAAPALADRDMEFKARLKGVNEVPAVSTGASGRFELEFDRRTGEGRWKLRYDGLEGNVLQSHIHFGQRGVAGGISVFLCTNLGNSPPNGAQPCAPSPAQLEGSFTAADVVGPAGQGIAPREFDELIRAMRQGLTYVNVHTSLVPSGEIRGQIKREDDDFKREDDD